MTWTISLTCDHPKCDTTRSESDLDGMRSVMTFTTNDTHPPTHLAKTIYEKALEAGWKQVSKFRFQCTKH